MYFINQWIPQRFLFISWEINQQQQAGPDLVVQLLVAGIEHVQFLTDEVVQDAAVHQRLAQLPDLRPVVRGVPQHALQRLVADAEMERADEFRRNEAGKKIWEKKKDGKEVKSRKGKSQTEIKPQIKSRQRSTVPKIHRRNW